MHARLRGASVVPGRSRESAMAAGVSVRTDDLTGPEIAALLAAHSALMEEVTPCGSCHYLPIEGLRIPEVSMWSAWDGDALVGCGALKEIGPDHGEVKSMHTAKAHRGRGVGRLILGVILDEARRRGYRRLSLETGSSGAFRPARSLYEKHGFVPCGPFASYGDDPNSAY